MELHISTAENDPIASVLHPAVAAAAPQVGLGELRSAVLEPTDSKGDGAAIAAYVGEAAAVGQLLWMIGQSIVESRRDTRAVATFKQTTEVLYLRTVEHFEELAEAIRASDVACERLVIHVQSERRLE